MSNYNFIEAVKKLISGEAGAIQPRGNTSRIIYRHNSLWWEGDDEPFLIADEVVTDEWIISKPINPSDADLALFLTNILRENPGFILGYKNDYYGFILDKNGDVNLKWESRRMLASIYKKSKDVPF